MIQVIIQVLAEMIRWFIEKTGTDEIADMGVRGRQYLEMNLTKSIY